MKNTKYKGKIINGDEFAIELGYSDFRELLQAFEKMKRMTAKELVKADLTDITEIVIGDSLNSIERVQSYLRQTKNPYFFRHNGEIIALSEYEKRRLKRFLQSCIFR